jgi:hypothetical protein
MAHFRKNVYQHLSSAKGWLTKAEEAFDKERDIRGELNLMLAQAELQHVKEANRSQHWRYKYAVVRHGVALTCAVVIATSLGGILWWSQRPETVAVSPPPTGQLSLPLDAKVLLNNTAVQAAPVYKEQEKEKPAIREEAVPVQQTAAEKVIRQPQKALQAEPTAAVSPDEMKKLVRAAGKSLRGQ